MSGADAAAGRLFVAVPLTEHARQEIVARLPVLPGRLVPPQNWHFTLRFLGHTEPLMRDALVAELAKERLGPAFSICFGGLGAFPRAKRARIVWLGVEEGAKKLISVAESVERTVRRAGFPAEQRPFKPHLTLSRIEPTRSVADVLTARAPLNVKMPVTELALVRSELGKGPAQYRVLERFPLGETD
jgi:RNA 2',3'-cyclic 3'-phosphodiesterase